MKLALSEIEQITYCKQHKGFPYRHGRHGDSDVSLSYNEERSHSD